MSGKQTKVTHLLSLLSVILECKCIEVDILFKISGDGILMRNNRKQLQSDLIMIFGDRTSISNGRKELYSDLIRVSGDGTLM